MSYDKFTYLYPARPKVTFPPEKLNQFEKTERYVAQPKLNGSCTIVFTDGKELHIYNRHKDKLGKSFSKYFKIEDEEIMKLYSGKGWMVLAGEYMNKACKDENGKFWNHKYCIFDILVYNGELLKGKKIEERLSILEKIYPGKETKPLLSPITENCYLIRTITDQFDTIWNKITKHDMYEGLVLKTKRAKLENPITKTANEHSQIKCRKPTKNYPY